MYLFKANLLTQEICLENYGGVTFAINFRSTQIFVGSGISNSIQLITGQMITAFLPHRGNHTYLPVNKINKLDTF